MTCPVPLLQDDQELARLLEILRELKPVKILEIGSLYGGTLWHWMTTFPGSTVVSIDKTAVDVPQHPQEKTAACRALWPEWAIENDCDLLDIDAYSDDLDVIELVKREYAPFDFIFIDGGHKYQAVEHDFTTFYPLLRKGGVMALHDCAVGDNDPDIDVGRFWRELAAEWPGNTQLINTTPGLWGIGVIRKWQS